MKKLVLTGIGRIEMIDSPKPELKNPDDVLIRIKTVGGLWIGCPLFH